MKLAIGDLPEFLQEIVELIGFEATLRLVERFGGIRVWVPDRPRKLTEEHPLVIAVGIVAARKMCERFALEFLPIPKATAAIRHARNRQILHLYQVEGWTAARLARHFELTERQIYSILATPAPAESIQAALF